MENCIEDIISEIGEEISEEIINNVEYFEPKSYEYALGIVKKIVSNKVREYKGKIFLAVPSVYKRKAIGLRESYVAVWMQDNLPQHCQCSSEEEAWYIIQDREEKEKK